MGHLRSTITGNFVKNVAKFAGHECKSICFLGDWGKQFGVLHAGVMEQVGDGNFDEHIKTLSLHQLLEIYVKGSKQAVSDAKFGEEARRYSALLESGDAECKNLWSHTRSLTLEHLKSCYAKLGVDFDQYEGEAEFHRESPSTIEALRLLESFNLTSRHEDGSLRIRLDDDNHILLKRDNSSVYLLRDIACALNRVRKSPPSAKLVYVVDTAQSFHFRNLFKTMRLMGINIDNAHTDPPFQSTFTHVGFGKVQGMSTRSGNFVLLSDVIDVGTKIMHDSRRKSKNARNIEDTSLSEKLAISGMVINSLRVKRNNSYVFSWDEALRSKGNSGVALQYGAARLRSLLEKAGNFDEGEKDITECLGIILKKNELTDLLVCLANFEENFWKSYTTLEPCVLVVYSLLLADKISKSLALVNVLNNEDKRLRAACLWLYGVSRNVLENCMRILGVPVLDRGF